MSVQSRPDPGLSGCWQPARIGFISVWSEVSACGLLCAQVGLAGEGALVTGSAELCGFPGGSVV